MQINKSKLRQAVAYLSIAVVSTLSIFFYATGNWRHGIITIGVGFLLLMGFAVLILWDDSDDQ
ncbi:MAG: hypothetical protein R2825_09190 [Saprospiraceae bacterium]